MMIPFTRAQEIVMSHARTLSAEQVPLSQALHRILAENVCSDIDMPPFDKSAMDGFACRRTDLALELRIIEIIQAGALPKNEINPGECAKIMTGAMLPQGADCVFMIEYAQETQPGFVRFTGASTRNNICKRGEDIRAGNQVLPCGVRIQPQHIAVLAAAGCANPWVYRQVRLGIIATGDELVEPGEPLAPSQIRNSNSHQLFAQALAAGVNPTYYGIVRDTREATDRALKKAIAENDVVLLSGGVSKGDFDLVQDVMTQNGIEVLFDAIAMKPGKPTTFGIAPNAYCFGLPGNPVSTFIQFEVLVKPFLYKLMGHDYTPPYSLMPLAEPFTAKRMDRETWIPVKRLPDGAIRPVAYHGSAHINALCEADGVVMFPIGTEQVEKGTLLRVRPL